MVTKINKVKDKNSCAREQWVRAKLLELPHDARLLDAGAGEQPYKKYCGHLLYSSQDFGEYVGTGSVGLHMGSWDVSAVQIISDIVDIPAADASFEAILCTEVIEHVPDPQLALAEMHRLLMPGGKLILTAPFCSLTHFSPFHYATGFSRFFYEHHLAKLGFEILELNFNGNFFDYLVQEADRVDFVQRKYCGSARFGIIDKLAILFFKILMGRLSKKDRGSEELLCFGLHVLAEKKRGS